jgi:hypothetical protein
MKIILKNNIMKTLVLIFLALPYVVLGQCPPAGNGSLKAEI